VWQLNLHYLKGWEALKFDASFRLHHLQDSNQKELGKEGHINSDSSIGRGLTWMPAYWLMPSTLTSANCLQCQLQKIWLCFLYSKHNTPMAKLYNQFEHRLKWLDFQNVQVQFLIGNSIFI